MVGTALEKPSASDRTGTRSRISMAARNEAALGDGDGVVMGKSPCPGFWRSRRDEGSGVVGENSYGPMDGGWVIYDCC